MTKAFTPTMDFLVRLRKIDDAGLKVRDALVLWAIAREPGMMGREVAMKLGYKSRSNVQDCVKRLMIAKFVEDRRPVVNQMTPNDLYILPAGETFLADLVPA